MNVFIARMSSFLAIASVILACGGSDGNSGSSSTQAVSCTTSTDCPIWQCRCVDGSGSSTGSTCSHSTCSDQKQLCDDNCAAHGGVKSFQQYPDSWATITGSSACQAYCAKYNSVFGSCPAGGNFMPTCDPALDCQPHADDCPASLAARLKCEVDTGTWSCSGISGGDSCPTTSLCSGG